jgi:beta-galactosidase
MSLRFVDSQELEGEAQSLSGPGISAFDTSPRTFWHSRWQEAADPMPHELQIDLGANYNVNGFAYLPRQNSANGRIAQYEFYVSTDGANWGSAVATGTFPDSTAQQTISFTAKAGRYVRLRALSSVNGQPFAAVADLRVRIVRSGGGVQTLDDRALTYTGSWQTCANCGADLYAGTNTWSNVADSLATYTFTGTQIRLYGVRDPRHGTGEVSVDGGPVSTVDFLGTTRQGNQLLWTSPVLPPGMHTFRLRVTGNAYVVPDRIDISG